jgi:hypothetical protein
MNEQKSLIHHLVEAVDRYRTERRVAAPAQDIQPRQSGRLGRLLRWLMPNGGTLLLVALLILTTNVWARPLLSPAAAPGPSAYTVNYQGRLADSGGSPLTGTYGMTFALWDAATGGSLAWGPESHAAVPVSDGLFSVGLGSQTSGGIPTNVWDGDRYLEITVGGETLSPRELIRSVPIAGMALTVPDGAITSRQVHLTNGRVSPTIDKMDLTTSEQTVPGMSVELSPNTNQTFLFYLVVQFSDYDSPASGYGHALLYVDGSTIDPGRGALMSWDATLGTVAQVYRIDLDAGTHTIEVRANSPYGGGQIWRWDTSLTWLAVSQ